MNTYQQHSNLQFTTEGVLSQLSFIRSLFYTITGALIPIKRCKQQKQDTKCAYKEVLRHIWINASTALAT